MNAANLAVIFAPCILRRSQCIHAQDQLLDVQKQAICVQALVDEKLKQYCETLNQFVELEQASAKVSTFMFFSGSRLKRMQHCWEKIIEHNLN